MRYAVGLTVAGLVLVSAFLFLTADLRGWTPANFLDPATIVEPAQAGKAGFAIADCFPWTVDPWNIPTARDDPQFDSQTMLTCRSRDSVLWTIGIYLLLTLTGLALLHRRLRISGKRSA